MLVWIVFSTITYFVPLRQGGRAKRRGVDFSFFLLSDFVVLTSS